MSQLGSFIWGTADILRGPYKARQYGNVILPMTILHGNAAEAIQDITGGGADMSLDALGIQATITNSLTCLRPGGRHVQVGLTGAD